MTPAERLGQYIQRRRLALGASVNWASGRVPVARQTWTAIEAGTQALSPHRYTGFERVLGWAPGSIEAVLAGGEPTLAAPGPGDIDLTVILPRPPVSGSESAPGLAAEIERIGRLRIPLVERRAAVRALIDMWSDTEPESDEDGAAG